MMVKDIASTRQTIPMWNGYQKGLEALSALISSTNLSKAQPKKSNGVGDLLVKVRTPT